MELESVEIGTTIVCAMKTVIMIAIACGVEIGNRMKTAIRVASPKRCRLGVVGSVAIAAT